MGVAAMLWSVLAEQVLGTVLFDGDFTQSVQASPKWSTGTAAFGWVNSLAAYAPAANLATVQNGAMFMTGSQVQAGLTGGGYDIDLTGGQYTATITWSPGFIAPMDEDVTVAFCNVAPAPAGRGRPGRQNLDGACVHAQLFDVSGTFDVSAQLNLGPSDQEHADCGDFRTLADSNGQASVTMSLTVNATHATFVTGIAGCAPMVRPLTGSVFDPTAPAWLYLEADDDNLNLVEVTSVAVTRAGGASLYSTSFGSRATFEAEWLSSNLNSLGCVGYADEGHGTVFVLDRPFLEVHGPQLALMANVGADYAGATHDGSLTATQTFSVEMTVMPDWLAPTTTDNDVAILLCTSAGITTWTPQGTSSCAVFSMTDVTRPQPKSYRKQAAMPTGQVYGDEGLNTCFVGPFVTLQVRYTPTQIVFSDVHTDGSRCEPIAIGNPFPPSASIYVYMGVDDTSYFWTTIVDFRVVSDEADLVPSTGPPLAHPFVPTTCPERVTMWLWFGTSSCGPNYDYATQRNFLVGELSGGDDGLLIDGVCRVVTNSEVATINLAAECGATPTAIASANVGVNGCNGLIYDSSTDPSFASGQELQFGQCYPVDTSVIAPYGTAYFPSLAPSAGCAGGGSCGSFILTGRCPGRPSPPPESPSMPPTPAPPPFAYAVTTSFTAAGDVSDFDDATLEAMSAIFAFEAGGVPTSAVTITVASGSVVITVTITAETSRIATSITSNLNRGILGSPAAINAALSAVSLPGPVNIITSRPATVGPPKVEDDNSEYIIPIIVLAIAFVIATLVAIWALNNKYHARPIFHPIVQQQIKAPSGTQLQEMRSATAHEAATL